MKTIVNFYIFHKFTGTRDMEGFTAQVKLYNSQGWLIGTGWSKYNVDQGIDTKFSVISSFAAEIEDTETYYFDYSVCCKFTAIVNGSIRLGNNDTTSFNSGTTVAQYSANNSNNKISGAAIIANQSIPTVTQYNMPLPNGIEVSFT